MSVPHVTSIMKLFGPDRNRKAKDTQILHHILDYNNKLPTCMSPKHDLQPLIEFADLINRTAFFASIDEPEIRQALIKIPESKANMEEFTKVALETSELIVGQQLCADAMDKVGGVK